jgi:hypothetical protein
LRVALAIARAYEEEERELREVEEEMGRLKERRISARERRIATIAAAKGQELSLCRTTYPRLRRRKRGMLGWYSFRGGRVRIITLESPG